jgi:glyoxylase-like metal-dependent hydrolase (beta-lactamase superfamily II)
MQPIRKVSVVSTGNVRIRPQHVDSTGSPLIWWLLTSRRWTAPRPINVYVIEHEQGLVLFDTGQDRNSVTDSDYFPKGLTGHLYARLARFAIRPGETLAERLRGIGYEPGQVRKVVLSHLHQDHIGGLAELASAEIMVSAREWAGLDSRWAEMNGLLARHIRLPGLRWNRVTLAPADDPSIAPFTEAHDLFGDGSLLLLPTPGHTPGSLSLLLRQTGMPPMLFVGDLTYDVEKLDAGRVPGVGRRRGLLGSTRAVNTLKDLYPGLVILAAHDPEASSFLRQALETSPAR